jgi:hypothetical protein
MDALTHRTLQESSEPFKGEGDAGKAEQAAMGVSHDEELRICAGSGSHGFECCPIWHSKYPEWELWALMEIESGGRTWMCSALDLLQAAI